MPALVPGTRLLLVMLVLLMENITRRIKSMLLIGRMSYGLVSSVSFFLACIHGNI